VIAVDPGTAKCGIAVVRGGGSSAGPAEVLAREIAAAGDAVSRVCALAREHGVVAVLVGDATAGKVLRANLSSALPPSIPVMPVPEAFTSQRARERYLRENPPRSLLARLLPTGLRTPDRPYDDYVAVLLAETYLATA
jgi:RNase H-fold protein (predicted Holliday junction resolvase)